MSDSTPVTHSVDAEGVGWIVFDDPTGRANVFNPTTQAAFRAAVSALAVQPLKAVVVYSAKEKIFIAGADLKWLVALPDAAAGKKLSREGQELFASLATLKVPVVCAIHGACAGGGYELALACHWRVASEAKETVIGLPEVGIGLIPGWGGCTPLPCGWRPRAWHPARRPRRWPRIFLRPSANGFRPACAASPRRWLCSRS